MKVGNKNGSYFKQAPKGANETPWNFGWRLCIEIELGSSKEFPEAERLCLEERGLYQWHRSGTGEYLQSLLNVNMLINKEIIKVRS